MTLISRLSLVACFVPLMVVSAQVVQVPAQPFPSYGSYGPANLYAAQLRLGGSYLGVHLVEVDEGRAVELRMPGPAGVEITSVAKGSPADEGGIVAGDVILEFRTEKVAGVEHFMRLVRETPVGREVPVLVWRHGAEQTLAVKVGKRQAPNITLLRKNCEGEDCTNQPFDFTMRNFGLHVPIPQVVMKTKVLGAELEGVKGQFGEFFGVDEGVLVRSVDSNSPAGRAQLQAGDVIVSVAGEAVKTPHQIHSKIRTADEEEISIEVMRSRKKRTLQIEPIRVRGSSSPRNRRARTIPTRRL
jgi:serine protease Do